ncbi:MAG: OmpH family outer membrane protein [Treponema sp.]|nr:OmpH family outer membrane protein [Treponema sp.]MCL2236739.1 OmpH family outer membrane protein [Treponema sp.]
MFKRIIILLLLSFMCAGFAFGQMITRAAVVDLPRIYTTFFRESAAVRAFEERSARIRAELAAVENEIQELRTRYSNAMQAGNQAEALRLESQISTRNDYYRQLHQTRTTELNNIRNNLLQSDVFMREVQEGVRFAAESEGYTLVFNLRDTQGLVWYSPSIDITDNVIQRLQRSRN